MEKNTSPGGIESGLHLPEKIDMFTYPSRLTCKGHTRISRSPLADCVQCSNAKITKINTCTRLIYRNHVTNSMVIFQVRPGMNS